MESFEGVGRKGNLAHLDIFKDAHYNKVIVAPMGMGMSVHLAQGIANSRFQIAVNALVLGSNIVIICEDEDSVSGLFKDLSMKYRLIYIGNNISQEEENGLIADLEDGGIILLCNRENFNALDEKTKDLVPFFFDEHFGSSLKYFWPKIVEKIENRDPIFEAAMKYLQELDVASNIKCKEIADIVSGILENIPSDFGYVLSPGFINIKNNI